MEEATIHVKDILQIDSIAGSAAESQSESLQVRVAAVETQFGRLQKAVTELNDQQQATTERLKKHEKAMAGLLTKVEILEKHLNLLLAPSTRLRAQRAAWQL